MRSLLQTIIILCVGLCCLAVAAKPNCTIKGRIVDESGEFVSGAFILIAPKNPTFASDLVGVGAEANEKGVFILEFPCAKTKKEKSLYVTSPVLRNVKTLLLPPFESLIDSNSLFGGIPILLKKDKVTDVGDIKIQIHYTVLKLALADKSGDQFFTTKEQWGKLWIRLRDEKGKLIVDRGMSVENYRDHTETDASALRIALPQGTWSIELFPEGRDGKFIARKSFTVNKTNSPVKVNLIVEDKQ